MRPAFVPSSGVITPRFWTVSEPTLTRHGYTVKVLAEMLGTKAGEINSLFKQTLDADRVRELKEQMLAAGLPV